VQQSLRMNGGSNFIQRTLHATIDAPSLQWTTPVASQVAGRYGQQIVSGALSGPIVLDHLFFDLPDGWSVTRRVLKDAYGSDHHPVVAVITETKHRDTNTRR